MKRPPELSQLASLFERWSNIETKRREASDDLKRIFADGKADGFNPKAMRVAFAEQYSLDNEDQATREKREKNSSEADLYLTALARVREGIDPTTGEILESIEPPVGHETVGRHAREPRPDVSSQPIQESHDATSLPLEDSGVSTSSAGTEGEQTGTFIQPETATESTAALKEVPGYPNDETAGSSRPALERNQDATPGSPGEPPLTAGINPRPSILTFTPKPLRPHCLRPQMCGGMGKDHCHSCQLAMDSARATA